MYEKFAYYYDRLGWKRFSETRASFVLNFIVENRLDVRRVLDLACGTGTFGILLAEKGIHVTGIDISEDMIAVAKKKAKEANAQIVEFDIGDMKDFKFDAQFDLVTCNYDSLNHLLREEDILSTFKCVYSHLTPKGTFIFDVNTISGVRSFKYQDIKHGDNHLVMRHGVFDEHSNMATMFIDGFVKEDKEEPLYYTRFQQTIHEKGYEIEKLYGLLKQAHFGDIEPVGPSSGKKPEELEKDGRVLICARK